MNVNKMFSFLKHLYFGKTQSEKTHEEKYEEYLAKREILDKEYEQKQHDLSTPYRVAKMGGHVEKFWKQLEIQLKIVTDEYKAKLLALDKEYETTIARQKARQEAIDKEENYKAML